jgi:hypothetical protein
MPDTEGVMREEVANLLRAINASRGAEINMLHWSHMLALDVAGEFGHYRAITIKKICLFQVMTGG